MLKSEELLLGSHNLNQNTSICAWNYSTGNIEHTYKNGGTSLRNSLCLLANDYVLAVNQDKPLLHIWPVNSQEQLKNVRFVMPDVINCIDVDSSNNYMVAGVGLKIYIWHINSGKLLNILQKHYQPVTCAKFSSDGAYVIVSGKDGMLIVYKLDDIACSANSYILQKNVGECEPIFTKMDHGSEITDICVGNFGSKSKIATVSKDLTCRIYILQTGELILTLVFNEILTSVLFDSTSWNIYVGDTKGLIRRVCLKNPPRTLEHHVESSQGDNFLGHKKKITCLAINLNNDILASGSEDFHIIIWETSNKNILRKIECNGIITNLKFTINHAHFGAQSFKSNIVLHPLARNIDNNIRNFVAYGKSSRITFDDEVNEEEREADVEVLECPSAEISKLKAINQQIYKAFIKMAKEYNDLK